MTTFGPKDAFSVILRNDNNIIQSVSSKFSNANSMKPLVYFSSAFGMQIINYSSIMIKGKVLGRLYCIFFVAVTISLVILIKPFSWKYTLKDIPLNVLTKCYGIFTEFEALYSIVIGTFTNSGNYVKIYGLLDSIDSHFEISQKMWKKRILMSVLFVLIPIFQVSCTFWMSKFSIYNISAHLIFFLMVLEGAIIIFFGFNILIDYLIFNILVTKKTEINISEHKSIIFKNSFCGRIIKDVLIMDSIDIKNFCWFELMQIYDKLADCMATFNNIYRGQVLLMFSSWMLCTLLTICRSLSPTIKYSEVILSDLFMYSSLNIRPVLLTTISEMFIDERKKTLSILMNYIVHGDLDDAYLDQVQTMIDLVETRKVEVSGGVFTANVPSILQFSGRTISYATLMIQYFYKHIYLE